MGFVHLQWRIWQWESVVCVRWSERKLFTFASLNAFFSLTSNLLINMSDYFQKIQMSPLSVLSSFTPIITSYCLRIKQSLCKAMFYQENLREYWLYLLLNVCRVEKQQLPCDYCSSFQQMLFKNRKWLERQVICALTPVVFTQSEGSCYLMRNWLQVFSAWVSLKSMQLLTYKKLCFIWMVNHKMASFSFLVVQSHQHSWMHNNAACCKALESWMVSVSHLI